jgi:DNA-binding transcriptional MerR regulator
MYTIKEAARLTGVPAASLRAWERRYDVVQPRRNEAGYRLYDDQAIATLAAMRRLVEGGWSPAEAAHAILAGSASVSGPVSVPPAHTSDDGTADATTYMRLLLEAAGRLDTTQIEDSLDGGFSLGSFEHVVDSWLFPTLAELGEAWARGELDVAGEHAASHAVHRRLSAAFNAAGHSANGPPVVLGLPPGSRHELGALAFATALRRSGLNVVYLGADVPLTSWEASVRTRRARAAVLAVVTESDRPPARAVANGLSAHDSTMVIASGGACGAHLAHHVHDLPLTIGSAAKELAALLNPSSRPS